MNKIELLPGKRYYYQRNAVRFLRVLDLHQVIVEYEATGALVTIPISQLAPILPEETPVALPQDDLLCISDSAWEKARQKLAILQPILADRGNKKLPKQVASAHGLHVSTIYRWLRAYEKTHSVQSLVEALNTGGRGQVRLDPAVDAVVQQAIQSDYLTTQKKTVTKVILEIKQQCRRAGLTAPGETTVRRRVQQLSEEEKVRLRWSKKMAKEQFEPLKRTFPGADYPLAVVQMDHTEVDIILVDEGYRQPLGRPYITMATDVFSRMVLGFYLSFDPPGAISAGLCVAQAILPKETHLSRIGVQGEWPCWGLPTVLHLDNAKEFRGKMLERACEKYGIRLEFRPVKEPHWGGHVERLMRTFMEETHTLPGTTFSNVRDRKEYDSEKKAVLTLPEFEQWLTTFIVNVYHRRVHQSLNTSPYERYREGILGAPGQIGIGLPDRLYDELQIRLDFMPGEERTVQEYGVLIDHVYYFADVLKPYVNSLAPGFGKSRAKRKFLFKRDPRDISYIYFLDPEAKQYHRIPYRNTAHPAISVWEFRQALALVKLKGKENVNEDDIFAAYDEMKKVELAAVERTRRLNKSSNRLVKGVPADALAALLPAPATRKIQISSDAPVVIPANQMQKERPIIAPFDDIHDDALIS